MPRRTKAAEFLDFEIVFYERLLHAYPDFVDALRALGNAYTRRGDYDKGLQVDLKLAQSRADEPWVWYNLACSFSLLNRIDEAAEALEKSIALGYTDVKYLLSDTDLSKLRQSPRFRQLLEQLSHHSRAEPSSRQPTPSKPQP